MSAPRRRLTVAELEARRGAVGRARDAVALLGVAVIAGLGYIAVGLAGLGHIMSPAGRAERRRRWAAIAPSAPDRGQPTADGQR